MNKVYRNPKRNKVIRASGHIIPMGADGIITIDSINDAEGVELCEYFVTKGVLVSGFDEEAQRPMNAEPDPMDAEETEEEEEEEEEASPEAEKKVSMADLLKKKK